MQVKPLLLTVIILGGLAYIADLWVMGDAAPVAPIKQGVISVPLTASTRSAADSAGLEAGYSLPDEFAISLGIQDLILIAKVEKRLFQADLLKQASVQVAASEGRVTITGQVASEENKRKIGDLARRVPGVASVENKIEVK